MNEDEEYKEAIKAIDELNNALEPMLEKLENIRDTLKGVNDSLGYTGRVEMIKENIRLLGWDRVCKSFHPDNNINDPAAQQMFDLVKYVYKTMKDKGEV